MGIMRLRPDDRKFLDKKKSVGSLYSYHKQKECIFFTKSENRRAEQFLSVELVPVGGKRR
jgi:hypothetical protein